MKNKKIFIISIAATIIIIILLVIFSITMTNKNNSSKKVDNKNIKPKLYLIDSDKIRHDKLSIAVFNGIDNDGRNISIALYSNLKCRYTGDENDVIANRKCYYKIANNKIIFTLDYPSKYTHTFTVDKDWTYLEDENGKYDNYLIKYLNEKNIDKVLVNADEFNALYYTDSGINILSNCDNNKDSNECDKNDILKLDEYDIVDTKGDFNKIKEDKTSDITLNGNFRTKEFDDNYGGEQHIKFFNDKTCEIAVEKNGLNIYQDGEYINCKYNTIMNKKDVSINLYADYKDNNNVTKAIFHFYADNKFIDSIKSFREIYSPSHRTFKLIANTELDEYRETIKFVEKITPDYKLHTSYDGDNVWWGPVKTSECNNTNLDVILKRLTNKYKVELYKGIDYINRDKNIILLSNNKYNAYIELNRVTGAYDHNSFYDSKIYVFDKDGDMHKNAIGLLVDNIDANIYDVLCKNN
ncbi:MAG: hypothetical protein IJI43_03820 [Bacilli bacterium]|nr:hypothetical protein [Bacilli bacterium]